MDPADLVVRARASFRGMDEWWNRLVAASSDSAVMREYSASLRKMKPAQFLALCRGEPFPFGDARRVAVHRELRWRELVRCDKEWRNMRRCRRARANTSAGSDVDRAIARSLRRMEQRGIYTGPKESTAC